MLDLSMKMADIDPFGEHDKMDTQPTWEPECEQETSFEGTSQRTEVLKEHVKALYHVLSENLGQTPEAFHFDDFKLRDEKLYCRDKSTSLVIRGGKLRSIGEIAKILGKEGLCDLGFDIPVGSKLKARWDIMLNIVEEELPSITDTGKADDIELQKITENAARSMDNLT